MRRYPPEQVAGIEWKPWPESIGMGDRNEMESPAGIPWNLWPDCSGICIHNPKNQNQSNLGSAYAQKGEKVL
jgi:hypothetical protein